MTDFYAKFPPLENASVHIAHIIQWGAPIISIIIFGFILWFFDGRAELTITVGSINVRMVYVFIVATIVQGIQAYKISQKIQRDAYITAYGNIARGVCTYVQYYPFAHIIVKVNEKIVKRSLSWSIPKKFNVNDVVQVRYNPDDDTEVVIYPYDTKNA